MGLCMLRSMKLKSFIMKEVVISSGRYNLDFCSGSGSLFTFL